MSTGGASAPLHTEHKRRDNVHERALEQMLWNSSKDTLSSVAEASTQAASSFTCFGKSSATTSDRSAVSSSARLICNKQHVTERANCQLPRR